MSHANRESAGAWRARAVIERAKTRVSSTTFNSTFRDERINYWMHADETARR